MGKGGGIIITGVNYVNTCEPNKAKKRYAK